ncbi:adenylate/guanylate cyclase domain-containing protein [Mesorhizobium sp. LHD-90]|uniref:adenylate/guanylate cyclase domain-containing protein n=1 Tax=Mesorhizobium sp. LHD-90 TaxID=3071414 RepID=UPI0027DFAB99|nr:adenylate/guanylate cyclase domain-containing protein [Mesorhizobium sp. LHD-90]MDQ6435040.1 adenylate/guanylate cyclase domain-containing protein [Mesorhizobium sp. LHD-90]
MQEQSRKLVAILAADVAGYSRLMSADEAGTLALLKKLRSEILDPEIDRHAGRVVGSAGDSLLVEFASALSAVECAMEMQRALAKENSNLPEDRRMAFRIGVNLGDVIADGDTIYGEGVNVAARLEKLAHPGAVCIGRNVYDQVKGKLPFVYRDLGEHKVHNIPEAVAVYAVDQPGNLIEQALNAGPLVLPDKPSIAILPFQNMSGDKEQDYFSDGIAEDIITALSKMRWIFVIARNSTFAYKGKAPDVRQVARELGVQYVLEGSVRRANDHLRVTAQLVDGANGIHVWAERYDRALADIFAVQDEITMSVVAAIEPELYAAENLRLRNRSPENLDAWGCVVRAMPYVWVWTVAETEIGFNLLQRAISIDPDYARATSLLGWLYAARAHLGLADPPQTLATAMSLAQRGIDQDDSDAWGHVTVGYVHMVGRHFNEAVAALGLAIDRNPSFALAHMILGSTYGYGGEAENGMRHLAIATRLSPRDSIQSATLSTIGTCHFMRGRFAEAVDFQHRAVKLRPHFGTAWRSLAAAAGMAGDTVLAGMALAEATKLQPDLSIAWVEAYHPIVHSKDRAVYVEGLRRAGLH